MSKVSIGNLSWNTNNDSLREVSSTPRLFLRPILPTTMPNSIHDQLFSTYGEVVDTIVMRDAETGRSRGFGFITFSSEGEAAAAAKALDSLVNCTCLDDLRRALNIIDAPF
ncbi:hypothetical protein CCMSSC00406_0002490 [Pleurotus cornucopiae]|uniref:Uncharacterized protein n=1 Tax=Pleurotus cornucopiae TaxID=5321 RepID=A0ACB7IS17_PLECO|nr:hypothetical protein CCMSSC00406_0002490 [Pleurotus cornucopiae]